MRLNVPASLQEEHEHFHHCLEKCMHEPGALGETAREVGRLLHLHCVSEEAIALPPLGLLARVARGEITSDMAEVVQITRKLKAELPRMFAEHARIEAALEKMHAAAHLARRPEYEQLASTLLLHAREEEEVLYPAAIVLGEYIADELAKRR